MSKMIITDELILNMDEVVSIERTIEGESFVTVSSRSIETFDGTVCTVNDTYTLGYSPKELLEIVFDSKSVLTEAVLEDIRIYNNTINSYIEQGYNEEEAVRLADQEDIRDGLTAKT